MNGYFSLLQTGEMIVLHNRQITQYDVDLMDLTIYFTQND